MAETLHGFWSLTSLGSTVDLSGKTRTASSQDELQFPGVVFSPGRVNNIKVVNLYNQAVKVCFFCTRCFCDLTLLAKQNIC